MLLTLTELCFNVVFGGVEGASHLIQDGIVRMRWRNRRQ